MVQHRQQLPIYKHRTHILYCVQNYQTTIIVGETGWWTVLILGVYKSVYYCVHLVVGGTQVYRLLYSGSNSNK